MLGLESLTNCKFSKIAWDHIFVAGEGEGGLWNRMDFGQLTSLLAREATTVSQWSWVQGISQPLNNWYSPSAGSVPALGELILHYGWSNYDDEILEQPLIYKLTLIIADKTNS